MSRRGPRRPELAERARVPIERMVAIGSWRRATLAHAGGPRNAHTGRRGPVGCRKSTASRSASTSATAPRLHELWDEVIDSQRWSEGPLTAALRGGLGGVERRARPSRCRSWTGGALAALEFAGVRGETVLCPSNTFMATPLAARAGGRRGRSSSTATATTSACRSRTSRRRPQRAPAAGGLPRAHRRPHRVRGRADRRALPRRTGIFLIEDCAHAHGADWNGRRPGHVGRRRRLLVLRDQDRLDRRGRHARLRATTT